MERYSILSGNKHLITIHFTHSHSFSDALSGSSALYYQLHDTHVCTLFVGDLKATYWEPHILIFISIWLETLRKKKYPGSRKSRILILGLSKSYIFGQSHSASSYCLESSSQKAVAVCPSSPGLLQHKERFFLTTKLYHIKLYISV